MPGGKLEKQWHHRLAMFSVYRCCAHNFMNLLWAEILK